MFALFFSLYYSMFAGTWVNTTHGVLAPIMGKILNKIGECLTSMFNNVDTPVQNLGDVIFGVTPYTQHTYSNVYCLVAFVLALITSIGIVVFAAKGIKRIFTIFFQGVR